MARIPILGNAAHGGDELAARKRYYNHWRQTNSATKAPFLALFKSFFKKGLLRDLDQGALRLYLYFGFVADNDEGNSWHSIETIADYFGVQTRTVDTWISKLVEADLIYRAKDNKASYTTFLIPHTDSLTLQSPQKKYDEDSQALVDDIVGGVRELEAVYGKLIGVYHIFHWGTDKKNRNPSEDVASFNMLFIITQRPGDILIGHQYRFAKSDQYGVSELQFGEVATFSSPFTFDGRSIQGFAVHHKNRLRNKESAQTLLELVRDLAMPDDEAWRQHPKLKYGLISEVLESSDGDEGDSGQEEEREETT